MKNKIRALVMGAVLLSVKGLSAQYFDTNISNEGQTFITTLNVSKYNSELMAIGHDVNYPGDKLVAGFLTDMEIKEAYLVLAEQNYDFSEGKTSAVILFDDGTSIEMEGGQNENFAFLNLYQEDIDILYDHEIVSITMRWSGLDKPVVYTLDMGPWIIQNILDHHIKDVKESSARQSAGWDKSRL